LNTDGSDFDTVLAVYTGGASGFGSLVEEACDNNGGLDGIDSSLHFTTEPGTLYLIVVDGVGAETGNLLLNYSLLIAGQVELLSVSAGQLQLRFSGRENMNLRIEESSDLDIWNPVIETNSSSAIFDYLLPDVSGRGLRSFRVVMLP